MRTLMAADLGVVALARIASHIPTIAVLGDIERTFVNDIVFDHREVKPGSLFCCIVGEHRDGHDFAAGAVNAGAAAFICEHSLGDAAKSLPQLVVAPGTARAAMALASCAFFDYPSSSMRAVGITGTNGKTTTSFILRSIMDRAGLNPRVLGTLDGARTTPEAPLLQRRLAEFRVANVHACAIEVSSHALAQHRVDGMTFAVSIFTNLTQDHLDYHHTMEEYFEAKASLFQPELTSAAVINADDPYGRRLIDRDSVPTLTYSLADARDLVIGRTESSFRLGGVPVRLPLGGRFNVLNALAAAAAARALGISVADIVAGLETAPAVPGRYETFASDDGLTAIVDFAHTPNGLEEILRAARSALPLADDQRVGRVLVVFGCGGDRDRGKRPIMGRVASELADEVYLTADNPRSEDSLAIIDEIRAGIACATPVRVERDRRRAITAAILEASRDDIVVVAGKGHETTQEFNDHVAHFDDREVVRDAILLRRARRVGPEGVTPA